MLAAKSDLLMKDDSRDSSAMRYSKPRIPAVSLLVNAETLTLQAGSWNTALPPPPSSKLLAALAGPYRGRIIPFETLFHRLLRDIPLKELPAARPTRIHPRNH